MQEKLIQLTLDVGEEIFVRKLSPLAVQAIIDQSKLLFPEPLEKDYIRPLSDIAPNAAEGMTIPGKDNPLFQADMQAARVKQNDYLSEKILMIGVVIDTPEGREKTIERYRGRLALMRQVIDLPSDEWLATVLYGLITTGNDKRQIVLTALGSISGEEIRTSMRTFREVV